MNDELLRELRAITKEEQAILDGRDTIDRNLYMLGPEDTINSTKLLAAGELITLRPKTRFIHFPPHNHDYVEVIYVCSGSVTQIVNGKRITLKQGELLFLNQWATHEEPRVDLDDIAVDFIVLPEFFSAPLALIGEEAAPLHQFLVGCLCGENIGSGYLHFEVAQVAPIQNLIENLIWSLLRQSRAKCKTRQLTMALLFLQLLAHTEKLSSDNVEETVVWQVLQYIENNYANGSFAQLCERLHYEASCLSRQIKQQTGKTYTQLVQDKRLAQAAFLLKNTTRKVDDVARAVGYENMSYFHRIFAEKYDRSPKHYRDDNNARKDTF